MKIRNVQSLFEEASKFVEVAEMSSTIANAITLPIGNHIVFKDEKALLHSAFLFRKRMSQDGIFYNNDESLIGAMLFDLIDRYTDISNVLPAVFDKMVRESKVLDKKFFTKNSYFENIKFGNEVLGKFELTHKSFSKYEMDHYNIPISIGPMSIPRVCCYMNHVEFPCISENNKVWMSVSPNEIFTMEEPIKNSFGNVLTLGCGMGYFAYMVAEKDNVNSVTIIEKEKDVIELFTKFILPQFPHKEKITIVQADALDYMQQLEDGTFNYCFADIWIGNTDCFPYIKLKEICKKFLKMTVEYWIEESIVQYLVGDVWWLIQKAMTEELHLEVPSMPKIENFPEEKLKLDFLEILMKDVVIEKPGDIEYYLNYKNIIKLIENVDCSRLQ